MVTLTFFVGKVTVFRYNNCYFNYSGVCYIFNKFICTSSETFQYINF